jgi:uncharacterized membrane protein
MQNPSQEQIENWRKDPKNWKLGYNIYYNPEDKRILVPKYYKWMGWTLNFAIKKSILIFIALILIPIAIIYIISFFKK